VSLSSTVGIATGSGLDGRGSIAGRGREFSLLHKVKTASRAHPIPYPFGAGGSFPRGKAARA
jgi:hypothetical protein